MAHSDCGWTCGCAGKTARSLENTCHTRALLRWRFTKRRYIKCTYLYLYLHRLPVPSNVHSPVSEIGLSSHMFINVMSVIWSSTRPEWAWQPSSAQTNGGGGSWEHSHQRQWEEREGRGREREMGNFLSNATNLSCIKIIFKRYLLSFKML